MMCFFNGNKNVSGCLSNFSFFFCCRVVRIMTYCACINLKVVTERFPEISDQEESIAEPCCSMFFFVQI